MGFNSVASMLFKPIDTKTTTIKSFKGTVLLLIYMIEYHSFNMIMRFLDIDSDTDPKAFMYLRGIKQGNAVPITVRRNYN